MVEDGVMKLTNSGNVPGEFIRKLQDLIRKGFSMRFSTQIGNDCNGH